ncbi:YggS family pyridoxal phosphate-dependent enzyme [Candidatus Latescibacterota bacterium]
MIADNVRNVKESIQNAALRSEREPSEITLVAVTKTRTAEEIEEAIRAGIEHCGENRLQEAMSKIPYVNSKAAWHMVGHLQSKKGKKAAALFDWIDSVDSKKIVDILSSQALKINKRINVLIQVNISGESAKSGTVPVEVKELVSYAVGSRGLDVRGLMAIGSFGVTPDITRAEFARMREIFENLREDKNVGLHMEVLSMGMSGDYRIAVEEGATMVRVGTAIFGARI